MLRRFGQHEIRQVQDLAGLWDFAFCGDVDPDAVDLGAVAFDEVAPVPGCFDATPAYAGRRGLAAYRTRVRLGGDQRCRLVLDGVHHWCRVLVDGEPKAEHVGGFTRFGVDLAPAGEPREAEVVILVDNRFDSARCPTHLGYYDWYHFGGIARGAELHRLPPVWIEAVSVVTEDYATRRVRIAVEYAAEAPVGATRLSIDCDGRDLLAETLELDQTCGTFETTVTLPDASLWSPEAPNLHHLHVRLGDDDLRERFGIRQVAVDRRGILINGRPVRLLGFNRHESHPQFGHAQPAALLVGDVQLLKDMGCNFVRGSHYPQDPAFLDLCDEAGLCVWNESIGWNNGPEHLTDEAFMAAQRTNVDEMVAMAFNRPSVIMWGVLNEGHSHDDACRPAYRELLQRLRRLDPSRPVTYACNHWQDDVCMDLADIVSINAYPGWYGASIDGIGEELDKIVARVDELGGGDKPMIISEIGAGAIRGWDDWNSARWSESYQSRLLRTVIEHMFGAGDRFAGLSIWQFCDIRTGEDARKAVGRPRCFNNKGVVDEYRRPKAAYATVKELFGRFGQ